MSNKKEFTKDICGIVLFPLLIAIICFSLFFVYLSPTIDTIKDGGYINYSDNGFIKYRDAQYKKYFGASSAKEDNILLIFLTTENYNRYYCLAEVGDNVNKDISVLFGGSASAFGKIVLETVPKENYKFAIDTSLAAIVNHMTNKVNNLKLESSFKESSDKSSLTPSQFVNYTSLSISKETVNSAINEFTDATDIPMVIVVDTAETVFGKTMPTKDIFFLVALVLVGGFCVFLIIKKVVARVKLEKALYGIKVDCPRSRHDEDDDDE
jgi:hypothetical protein